MGTCLHYKNGKCTMKNGCRFAKVEKDKKCPIKGEIGPVTIVRSSK